MKRRPLQAQVGNNYPCFTALLRNTSRNEPCTRESSDASWRRRFDNWRKQGRPVGEHPQALTLILVLDHHGMHGDATEGDLRVRSKVVIPSGVPRIARVRRDDDDRATVVEVDDCVPSTRPALGAPRFEYRGREDDCRGKAASGDLQQQRIELPTDGREMNRAILVVANAAYQRANTPGGLVGLTYRSLALNGNSSGTLVLPVRPHAAQRPGGSAGSRTVE